MNWTLYVAFICISISVINVVIVFRALKKMEHRKKNDKVILDGMKKFLEGAENDR